MFSISFLVFSLAVCVVAGPVATRTPELPTGSGRATCSFELIAGFLDVLLYESEQSIGVGGTLYNTTRPMLQYHRVHRFQNITLVTGQYSFPVRLSLYAIEASVDQTGAVTVKAFSPNQNFATDKSSCNSSFSMRFDWNASLVFTRSSSSRMTEASFEPFVSAATHTICGVRLDNGTNCGPVDEKALALAIGELFAPKIAKLNVTANATAEPDDFNVITRVNYMAAAPVPIYSTRVGNLSVRAHVLSRSFVTAGVRLEALLRVDQKRVLAHSTLVNLV